MALLQNLYRKNQKCTSLSQISFTSFSIPCLKAAHNCRLRSCAKCTCPLFQRRLFQTLVSLSGNNLRKIGSWLGEMTLQWVCCFRKHDFSLVFQKAHILDDGSRSISLSMQELDKQLLNTLEISQCRYRETKVLFELKAFVE